MAAKTKRTLLKAMASASEKKPFLHGVAASRFAGFRRHSGEIPGSD